MKTLEHFEFDVSEGVAVVLMNRSDDPVNTLGPAIFDDFETVIGRLESDPGIRGVVFGSAKKDFLVGADIRWFASLTEATAATEAILQGQAMFARLEALHLEKGKPLVMAIEGAALGGGLELALCGSMRLASDSPRTQLGQPEVQLGILPAGGATVRLPRLIGVAAALDLILTGRPVDSRKARKLGLVDEVVPREQLLAVARQRAAAAAATRPNPGSLARLQRFATEGNLVGRGIVFKKARDTVLTETRGNYPAPLKALEAIKTGIEDGPDAGYAAEARYFGELVVSPESLALRSLFFSQRELEKESYSPDPVPPVEQLAVLGGGLMGGGIAAVSAVIAGATVRIKEVDAAGIGRGLGYVRKYVDGRVKRRRLTGFEGERAMLKVTATTDWTGFGGTDLVIEAVFEDLELKRRILAEAEAVVPVGTVLATNTSSLPIAAIAEGVTRPEDVVGMHYFSPVEKMPLLEVVVTPQTSPRTTATAVEFGRRQGKTVIVVNDGTGFYTSRVLGPYSNEAMYLLSEGAAVDAIDEAMVAWGFPVGPLLLADEVGIDVGAKIAKIMVEAFGERMKGPDTMQGLVADDRRGRKNGRGFYRYEDGERKGVDESVYTVIDAPPRRSMGREEIQERISLQFLNEAARCLEEGILPSARDGDIGAVFGVGFPPFRGGPFHWIDTVGAAAVVDSLRRYESVHGPRFAPAPVLVEAATEGRRFRQ
jgi:3-hydroxyacyl-CoA dehydrogenase/enoyl-CoA hydratase/3-hydroxybutyryl-CoA epimerase